MASVYGAGSGSLDTSRIDAYLPLKVLHTGKEELTIARFDKSDAETSEIVQRLLNEEIESGLSWPFENKMDKDAFTNYFLSKSAAIVVKTSKGAVVGTFYVKPNYPGRCDGICNGGFIVSKEYRGQGIGKIMGAAYLRIAKDLGFHGSVFNLVFATNKASIALWESLGFTKIGTVPKCARLTGCADLIDANIYYYDLSSYSPQKHANLLRCSEGFSFVSASDFRKVGETLREHVQTSIASYQSLFSSVGLAWEEALQIASDRYSSSVPSWLVDEMKEFAVGANVPFNVVLAMNARTELFALGKSRRDWTSECTTVATSRFLAQNWDWKPEQESAIAVVDMAAVSNEKRRVVTLTEGGLLCKMGMNDAGLAVALNLIRSVDDCKKEGSGLPLHLLLRYLLAKCSNVQEALSLIRSVKVDASSCFTLMDASGNLEVVEICPSGVFVEGSRRRPDGLVAHTNHFVYAPHMQQAPLEPNSVSRLATAFKLLQESKPESVEALLQLLAFHCKEEGELASLCKHPGEHKGNICTLGVLIFDTTNKECHISSSRPCTGNEMIKIKF